LFFLNRREGFGINLIKEPVFTLSTSLGYAAGRDEDKASALNGLGDIDHGLTVITKGKLRYKMASFSMRYSRQITDADTGYLLNLKLGLGWRSSSGWFVRPNIFATYASEEYMDSFFGITTAQAANTTYEVYDPVAGFKNSGVDLMAGYRFSNDWSLVNQLTYTRLLAGAADSPITQDKNQFKFGLGVMRRF
jgi:MipA family protein